MPGRDEPDPSAEHERILDLPKRFFMYRTLTIAVHISTRTQNVWDYAIDGVKQNKYDATEPVSKFTLN